MNKLKMQTPNITQCNIEKIGSLFPNVLTETKDEQGNLVQAINFDKLRQELMDDIVDNNDESYDFTWVGKNQAVIDANTPIRKTLRPVVENEETPTGNDSQGNPYQSKGSKNFDTTENLYIEGDNLEVLKLLQESYLNSIKMIYIDPPYNTGKDSFVYPDKYTMDIDEYNEQIQYRNEDNEILFEQNNDTNPRFHSDWCSMIYSRLKLCKNLLTDDGVIIISLDDNEIDNLMKICDEIFGEINNITNFVWNCSTAGGIRPKFASKTHEHILCYAKKIKSIPMLFSPLSDDAKKMYTQKDKNGLYRDKDFIFKNKSTNINQRYEIVCPDGQIVRPKDGYIYRFIRETFDEHLKNDLVTFKQTKTGPLITNDNKQANWNIYIKKHLGNAMGAPATLVSKDLISIYNVGTQCVQDLFDGKRVFENVKPVDVIKYFTLMFANDKDATILDFFSGSATTAHAVMQLNAEDGGNRKFIMVQLPETTYHVKDGKEIPVKGSEEAYKVGYKNICEIGKERIHRAGEQIKKEVEENNIQLKIGEEPKKVPDIGFKVLKVDSTNMNDVYYGAGEITQDMLSSLVSNIKEDRTGIDLLYGVLLDWGIKLSSQCEKLIIDDVTVYNYDDKTLIACLDNEKVSENVVRQIAKMQPMRVVFRDDSFKNSPDKINVEEIFKLNAPGTSVKVI